MEYKYGQLVIFEGAIFKIIGTRLNGSLGLQEFDLERNEVVVDNPRLIYNVYPEASNVNIKLYR